MKADVPQYTDVCVDGIPVGPYYGVEVEQPPPTLATVYYGELATIRRPQPVRKFLTKQVGDRMVRHRELPPSAVLSARHGDVTVYL